jgi:multisubunit Na+/H+ antiporter MnhB subunit
MTDALLVFDIVLALAIVGIALGILLLRDAFAMIVCFVVFGLLSALAWVRLAAPDVALAEAAIGTGLTGALLLRTLAHLRGRPAAQPLRMSGALVLNAVLCGLVTLAGIGAFLSAPLGGPGLEALVAQNLAASGVSHPVTAVLLNYRAFDTLMEVVVLLVAVVAVWSMERGMARAPAPAMGEVYAGFARLVLPAAVIVGAYLLWVGAIAPGGAFQGGAVLAAVGLMLLVTRAYTPLPAHRGAARFAFVAGAVLFAGIALLVAQGGRATFAYPPAYAKELILVIEAVVTVSIAATLAALFHGREPVALPALAKEKRA